MAKSKQKSGFSFLSKLKQPRVMVALVFVLVFGGFGVWKLAFSSAATPNGGIVYTYAETARQLSLSDGAVLTRDPSNNFTVALVKSGVTTPNSGARMGSTDRLNNIATVFKGKNIRTCVRYRITAGSSWMLLYNMYNKNNLTQVYLPSTTTYQTLCTQFEQIPRKWEGYGFPEVRSGNADAYITSLIVEVK